MAQHISNGTVDLERYLKDGPPITKVKPASTFLEALLAKFRGEQQKRWGNLPFKKTLDMVRLRRGNLSVWSGVNGDGKSALLGQVMLGLMGAGERVCIASLEMEPGDTLMRMAQQASAKLEPGDEWLRDFAAWTDDKLWIYDHLGTVKWKYMVALARYLSAEVGITHLVIDSFTKCGIAPDDYETQKAFAEQLFEHCRATGLHIHLVTHMRKGDSKYHKRPTKFDVRGAGEITDIPDNLFLVVRNRDKEDKPDDPKLSKEADTFLMVEKQRHHPFEGTIALWFYKSIRRWTENGVDNPDPMDLGIEGYRVKLEAEA